MIYNKNHEVPYQVDNPTDKQRHTMLKYLLSLNSRLEDFDDIVEALSPPPEITTICPKSLGKNIKVAVIGGGEAGLSAAFELRKIGCSITLFEAADRIGGRIYTYYFDRDKNYYGELGAMRVPSSHETTWHYMNLFKLQTSPFPSQNINGLFYARDAYAVNDPYGISVMGNIYPKYNLYPKESKTPWQQLADRPIKKYLLPLPPEKRRELLEAMPVYSNEMQCIDMLNYRMAYENTGLSQDAISMLAYISQFDGVFYRLSLTEILQDNYTADFFFTYRINDGMISLPLSLFKAIRDEITDVYGSISCVELGRVKIRMGFAVDGIYQAPEGEGIILEYRNTSSYEYEFEKFDYVVCAIPFSSLRRMRIKPLFPVMKMQAINEMNYEIAQKTCLFLRDRFWEKGSPSTRIIGGSSSTDLPLISVYYPPDHSVPIRNVFGGWTFKPNTSSKEPGVLLTSYNWSMDAVRLGSENNKLLLYDVKRYIEKLHRLPWGYIDERLVSYQSILWSDIQYIWGGACLTKPGDKLLFSYIITLPEMNDRIFFAGEHISQKHAWQQGALKTGMIAANEVAKRVKIRKS